MKTTPNSAASSGSSPASCSAFRFTFVATDEKSITLTHLEGDLTVEQPGDLPHAVLAVLHGIVADWDLSRAASLTLSVQPNAAISDGQNHPTS